MVKLIVMVGIGILILSFFGISLRTVAFSPTAQDNFAFVSQVIGQSWNWLMAWLSGVGNSISHSI